MGRPDIQLYKASRPDWRRLHAYAQKVAATTKVQPIQDTETINLQKTRQVEVKKLFRSRTITETYEVAEKRDIGPKYWLLERRYWIKRERTAQLIDESHEFSNYRLHADGSLVVAHENWDETIVTPGGWTRYPSRWSYRPFEDQDLAIFDFEAKNYHRKGSISVDTNRDPDWAKLKHHAPGIGLSLALKRLLEGC